jgi:RNA polymerase sigma-70 factor (ECF subfamily)
MTTEAATATSPQPLRAAGRPEPGAAGAYLAELFEAHGRMVLGLCRLVLRDAVDAEDATQQVFLSAYRSLLRGGVPRDAQPWLAAIARNECRARVRLRMREPLALPDFPDDLPDPLATAIRSADLDALWTALSELPRRQRRAFLLREMGGLSYGELGAALGVNRPAVESLLFRARRQLRRALAGTNAAFVPVALRDQLEQLIPNFGSASAASIPVAAKVAAVTVGVGLGAAGVASVPHHHHLHVTHAPQAARVVHASATPVHLVRQPAIEPRSTRVPVTPKQTTEAREPEQDREQSLAEPEQRDAPQAQPEIEQRDDGGTPAQRSELESSDGGDSVEPADGDD